MPRYITKSLRVNYIIEINKFYDWLETNSIPKSAIALWHALLHINNKTGWIEEFSVAMSVLELKTGFKSSELFKARNILQEKGRITWEKRGGNLSATYRMIFFSLHTMDANGDAIVNTKINSRDRQMGNIIKQEETTSNNLLEEEDFNNLKYDVPDDGLPHNLEGLIHFLSTETSASKKEAHEIIIKSNYGQKKTTLWPAIIKIRTTRNTQKPINNPISYLLEVLRRDKILNPKID